MPIDDTIVIDRNFIANNGERPLARSIDEYPGGLILPIDKPFRWTSADVIRKIKFAACKHFSKKNLKVGHAGTLDPLATGILLVCIGKEATRQAETLQKHDKEYIAGITFGATTPSYDLEKEIDRMYPYDGVSEESLKAVLPTFIGEQEQVAPLFSAKSVDGVRAYELARKMYRQALRGETVKFDQSAEDILTKQKIVISEMELLGFWPEGKEKEETLEKENSRNSRIHLTDNSSLHLPHAEIRVACSKGTYIRALARDLGESLASGAHLDSLCRSRSGDFRIENAITVEQAMNLLSI